MPTCGIYKLSIIGDDDQERFYYGRSSNVRRRVWQHLRDLKHGVHYNRRMQRTYDKYKNIGTSIVAICGEDCVASVEGMFIHTHINDRMCLNQAGVDPEGRIRLSDKTRRRMSKAKTGRYVSQETRDRLSKIMTGRRHSEETRKKISEVQRGRVLGEAWRRRLSEANRGRVVTDETRRKLSEANLGKKMSDEARKSMSDAHAGKPRPWRRKGVLLTSPNGELLEFDGLDAAAAYVGTSIAALSRYLNGVSNWANARKSTPIAGWTGHYIDKEAESGN